MYRIVTEIMLRKSKIWARESLCASDSMALTVHAPHALTRPSPSIRTATENTTYTSECLLDNAPSRLSIKAWQFQHVQLDQVAVRRRGVCTDRQCLTAWDV